FARVPGATKPIWLTAQQIGRADMMLGTRSLARLAAFAVAVLFIGAPGHLSAEQLHDAIRISDADLGGVVTGAHGPEAGGSRKRPSCPPDMRRSLSPTIRAGTCCLICRRRTTTSGSAATVSSIRRRCRQRQARFSI